MTCTAAALTGGLLSLSAPNRIVYLFAWLPPFALQMINFFFLRARKRRRWASCIRAAWGPGWPERSQPLPSNLWAQQMTFLNGGLAQALTPAFSYSVACKDQAEIDRYWDRLLKGGKPMACGWLTDKFGLCWQIVPEKIGEILKHPKAMAAMMKMVKFDIAALEAAAKD